jgi:hypothetical protein
MRTKTYRMSLRFIGIVLIAAAIFGWLISLSGVVGVWVLRPKVTAFLEGQVLLMKGTLEVTTRGLDITQKSLGAIVGSLDVLQSTVKSTADTVSLTGPILDTLVKVTEENLPNTVSSVQDSLVSAQQGAGVIDNALKAITSIPLLNSLLGGVSYNPPTPLGDALDSAAGRLDDLTSSLNDMADGIKDTQANIEDVQGGIQNMAVRIGEINTNLQEAQSVIAEYQTMMQGLLDLLKRWEGRIPQLITWLAMILTVLLLWIAVTQLGLFMQGLGYVSLRFTLRSQPTLQGTESETRPD